MNEAAPTAPAPAAAVPEFLQRDIRAEWGKLLELTSSQEARLKKWLKNRLTEWETDTQELATRLIEANQLVEGLIDETDFPWTGCSNVHVPISEMYMEVYKSIEKRSLLGADIIWYASTDEDGELADVLVDAEQALNYYARNEWNVEDAISKVLWTTNRDGLGIIQATWQEEYEPIDDILYVRNPKDFIEEFPDAESAGLTDEQWIEAIQYIAQNASDEFPIEVPMSCDRQVYNGVKCEIVELINFVRFPTDIEHIKDPRCRMYGKRFRMRKEQLKEKASKSVFYKSAVEKLISKKGKGNTTSTWNQSRNEIDGISDSNTDDFGMFELVVRGHLDGTKSANPSDPERTEEVSDKREMKLIVTYSKEHDELVQCAKYFYRVDFYALFKIGERPGRIQGPSVPAKTRDMNDEIDTQHNQRINIRTISSVPSFKAQEGIRKTFDPSAEENRFRPGVVFWLENFESFEQFTVQPTDLGESMAEEKNDMAILDLLLGSPASLFSGGAPTQDPTAPGNKTDMLINQGNLRMDDPLDELRKGVNELGNICASHLYQFGSPILRFMVEVERGSEVAQEERFVHKRHFGRGLKMNMRAVTVAQNPDTEMKSMLNLHATLLKLEPEFYAGNPEARMEGLREALRRGRIPNRHKLLPSIEQIQARQVEVQKQALEQLLTERALAMKDQAAAGVKARLGQARQDISLKKTAEATAASGLGIQ
jgi:hypothetical protein